MIKLGAIERKEESKAEKALGLLALEVNKLECAAEAHLVDDQLKNCKIIMERISVL